MTVCGEGLSGCTPAHRSSRVEVARQHADWFDFDPLREITAVAAAERPVESDDGLGFLRYDPDFVYRYLPVPDITVGQAVEAGVLCSRQAAQRFGVPFIDATG